MSDPPTTLHSFKIIVTHKSPASNRPHGYARKRFVIAVDFGGVLIRKRHPQTLRKWERRLGVKKDLLTRMLFTHPASELAINGEIGQPELVRTIAADWAISQRAFRRFMSEYWHAHSRNEKLLAALEQYRECCRIVVLSNMWPNWNFVMCRHFELAEYFDRFYVSASMGLSKPDPQIFRHVLESEGIADPARMLFIDDLGPNITAARKLGIRTVWFSDNTALLRSIAAWTEAVRLY